MTVTEISRKDKVTVYGAFTGTVTDIDECCDLVKVKPDGDYLTEGSWFALKNVKRQLPAEPTVGSVIRYGMYDLYVRQTDGLWHYLSSSSGQIDRYLTLKWANADFRRVYLVKPADKPLA